MADTNEEIAEEPVEQEETAPVVSPLDLSDEEFANYEEPVEAPEVEQEPEEEPAVEEKEEVAPEADEPDAEDKDVFDESSDAEPVEEKAEDEEDKEETTAAQYKDTHDRIFAPFKANNKEMKVDNVEDAISLMQMGANYNKKMAGMKKPLRFIKMLENNDLLDETKLSYLIDLDKKSPEAIAKLVKESGIDPLEIDTTEDTEYKPNTYTVDDLQVELDTVIEDIRDTDSFKDTIDIVSNKWDEASRNALLEKPSILKAINEHVAAGVYTQVTDIVERERVMGRLKGLSDLEAYRQVGDALQAQGAKKSAPKANEKFVASSKKAPTDTTLASRKKAASPTKSSASSGKGKQDYNPLSMSDAEFEKQMNSGLL